MSIEEVIKNDMCVGCGGCAVVTRGKVSVTIGSRGYYSATLGELTQSERDAASRVCPFSEDAPNEDEISQTSFPSLPRDSRLGSFGKIWAGQITDSSEIIRSSSGGITTWLVARLLRAGLVDGVIHVGPTQNGPLFGYKISRSVEEVMNQRKSLYYSTTFADVLNEVRNDGRRYALVGVPCFIRSARLVAKEDPEVAASLKYFIGIVCGHMKASGYAESLAWQKGIPPNELATVDFRIKDPAKSAKHYKFGARPKGSLETREAPPGALLGANWGHAAFQLNACNFCDDIYAETADVVLGDAWLPKYEADWKGTNVIITRNVDLSSIIEEGLTAGELILEPMTVDDAAEAQAGNYRHRRQGLAVRLADDQRRGLWTPRKRVRGSYEGVSRRRRAVIRMRRQLSEESFRHFARARATGNLDDYLQPMQPLIRAYSRRARTPFLRRVVRRTTRELWMLRGRIFGSR